MAAAALEEQVQELVQKHLSSVFEQLSAELACLSVRVGRLEHPEQQRLSTERAKSFTDPAASSDLDEEYVPVGHLSYSCPGAPGVHDDDDVSVMDERCHSSQLMEERDLSIDMVQLPNSFFSYCVAGMVKSHSLTSTYSWQLLLLLLMQQVLVLTLCDTAVANDLFGAEDKSFTKHMCGYAFKDPFSFLYPFESKLLYGKPWPLSLAAMVALSIVAVTLTGHDDQVLRTMFPSSQMSLGIRCLFRYAWFVEAILLPSVFSNSVVFVVAQSKDALALVMNAMAVSFILEVDDLLYDYTLSPAQKEAYQATRYLAQGMAAKRANALQKLRGYNIISMLLMFCWVLSGHWIRLWDQTGLPNDIVSVTLHAITPALPWILSYGFRGVVHRDVERGSQRGSWRQACRDFLFFCCLGVTYYLVFAHPWIGPDFVRRHTKC